MKSKVCNARALPYTAEFGNTVAFVGPTSTQMYKLHLPSMHIVSNHLRWTFRLSLPSDVDCSGSSRFYTQRRSLRLKIVTNCKEGLDRNVRT